MSDRPLTILIIGTLPPPIGGAGISLQHLLAGLATRGDVRVIMVNTGGVRGHPWRGPFRFVRIVWRIVTGAGRADVVSLQAVPNGLPFTGPFAWAAVRLWGKPFMIRMFGGQDYLEVPGLRGQMVRWYVRRTDLYLAQTQALVRTARADGLKRVEWLPTSRPMRAIVETETATHSNRSPPVAAKCRRFVFLGHVKPAKGIRELISAAERMNGQASVDVYGPLLDGVTEETFAGKQFIRYRGVVPAGQADEVLRQYDAAVLPTYWVGEGYPGAILEAYGAGLPIITTRWLAIPEIVDDTSGILIEPRNADALYEAMVRLCSDDALYAQLRQGVRAKRAFFESQRWVDQFVVWCGELARIRQTTA